MQQLEKLLETAKNIRRRFERGEIDKKHLAKLYMDYNSLKNIRLFINRAQIIFPKLNCGLATISLKNLLGQGKIINGRYKGSNHTFLLIDKKIVVDITADQFGGPKVYVGLLQSPWQKSNQQLFSKSLYISKP